MRWVEDCRHVLGSCRRTVLKGVSSSGPRWSIVRPSSRYVEVVSPSLAWQRFGNTPGGKYRTEWETLGPVAPANPVEVSSWGFLQEGLTPGTAQGCDPDALFGHGAEPSADGKLVFLSYWDSGFVALDVTDPLHPVFRGRTVYLANADGAGHSSNYDDARRLLFTADEDFCKSSGAGIEKGFGYLRVYDYANLAAPVQNRRVPNSELTRHPTTRRPATTRSTTPCSWEPPSMRPGTRTAFG